MTHAIRKKDPNIADAVRRIAADQIEVMLFALANTDLPLSERVHQARKSIKHLRGLIRLVRPAFPAYAVTNVILRDAGRQIAALRDAQVALLTFDSMAQAADLSPAKSAALRVAFEARLQSAQSPDLLAQQLSGFSARMLKVGKDVAGWTINRHGFDALEHGLKRSLKAARADEVCARAKPGPDIVHDWRKRVKDHWHQARFLAPIWPEMMQMQIDAAGTLGEILGEYQDISVLFGLLPNGRSAEAMLKAGRAKQAGLLGVAHPLSRRLFADTPDALTDRWRTWWQVWRST